MRPISLCLAALAVLAQGCLVGRNLYYVDEAPSSDALTTSAVGEGDAGAGGDGSTGPNGSNNGTSIAPPAPPALPKADAGAPGTETCTGFAVTCEKGGAIEYCSTISAAGTCVKGSYKYGGKEYTCPTGCGGQDCLPQYYAAYTSCQNAAGSCADLESCCNAAQPVYQPSCLDTHKTYVKEPYGEVACKSVVASYRTQKICP